MLAKVTLEKYILAGRIAARVREDIKKTTREGMLLIEICEKAEKMIKKMGGLPAFPCNVSVNEIAAHYTSPPNDLEVVPMDSVLKIDIGVHVDGYIADTATTICFSSEYKDMAESSEVALETAIKMIRPGIHISDLGSEIQRVIEARGFKPISNLTGHQIGRFVVHTGRTLPNIAHVALARIRPGDVYAIEPFVTEANAAGKVIEGPEAYIFRFLKRRHQKNNKAKSLLRYLEKTYKTLPFAERWLRSSSLFEYKDEFRELVESKCLIEYPVFVEASRSYVAQFEHTVYIDEKEAIILTS